MFERVNLSHQPVTGRSGQGFSGKAPARLELGQMLRARQGPGAAGEHRLAGPLQCAAGPQTHRHALRGEGVGILTAIGDGAHPPGQGMGRGIGEFRFPTVMLHAEPPMQQGLGNHIAHAQPRIGRRRLRHIGPPGQPRQNRRAGDHDLLDIIDPKAVGGLQRQHAFDAAMGGAAGGVRLMAQLGDQEAVTKARHDRGEIIAPLEQRQETEGAVQAEAGRGDAGAGNVDGLQRRAGVEANLHRQHRRGLDMRLHGTAGL